MYKAFGDESHDESRSRVFAVAGILGDQSAWDTARQNWIERTGGKEFHAADCDSDRGTFSSFKHEDNKRLYRDLTNILGTSGLLGFGAAISLADYNRVFGDRLDYKPYYFCFLEVILEMARLSAVFIPPAKVM